MARRDTRARSRSRRYSTRRFRLPHLLLVMLILPSTIGFVLASPQLTVPEPFNQFPPPEGVLRGWGNSTVVVDGAKNPELINSDLLIAQLLGAQALPPSPSQKEERRVEFFAKRLGLGPDDSRIVRLEMFRLYAAIAPIQARLQVRRDSVPHDDLSAYRAARLESYGRLLKLLSADGQRKLNTYIDEQKRHTKIVSRSPSR